MVSRGGFLGPLVAAEHSHTSMSRKLIPAPELCSFFCSRERHRKFGRRDCRHTAQRFARPDSSLVQIHPRTGTRLARFGDHWIVVEGGDPDEFIRTAPWQDQLVGTRVIGSVQSSVVGETPELRGLAFQSRRWEGSRGSSIASRRTARGGWRQAIQYAPRAATRQHARARARLDREDKPLPLDFGLDGRLLLARRGRVCV